MTWYVVISQKSGRARFKPVFVPAFIDETGVDRLIIDGEEYRAGKDGTITIPRHIMARCGIPDSNGRLRARVQPRPDIKDGERVIIVDVDPYLAIVEGQKTGDLAVYPHPEDQARIGDDIDEEMEFSEFSYDDGYTQWLEDGEDLFGYEDGSEGFRDWDKEIDYFFPGKKGK